MGYSPWGRKESDMTEQLSTAQQCAQPTLYDPMDYSPPGSSVHGFLQARTLEWVAMPSSGDILDPRIDLHLLHLLH